MHAEFRKPRRSRALSLKAEGFMNWRAGVKKLSDLQSVSQNIFSSEVEVLEHLASGNDQDHGS